MEFLEKLVGRLFSDFIVAFPAPDSIAGYRLAFTKDDQRYLSGLRESLQRDPFKRRVTGDKSKRKPLGHLF